MICYEDFDPQRVVAYGTDIDAWRNGAGSCSLAAFGLEQSQAYLLSVDENLRAKLEELLSKGLSLRDAIYKLRAGYVGFRGDVVFAYRRTRVEHASMKVA